MRYAALAAAVVLALAGCGRGDARDSAQAVTERFVAAVAAGDGDLACAQLTPAARVELEDQEQRACREAVTELDLGGGAVSRVQVYVTSAIAELSTGEVAFLDERDEGWRIAAAGCTAVGNPDETPYNCELES